MADVIAVLEAAYPPALAESWDTGIGLTCGDPAENVRSVLFAVDADPSTIDEAIGSGVQLLVTHHPLLFRPVQSVAADTVKGSLIHRLGRAGIAHFAAHTNADRAERGVNDALADTLGVRHPIPLPADQPGTTGLGRIGDLVQPIRADQFAAVVAAALPGTVTGARLAGDPARLVRRVAVCGGAGGSLLELAARTGADVFVTADLTHHATAEFVAQPGNPVLIDVAHWASEWPWLTFAAEVLQAELGAAITTTVSTVRTDPWTARAG